MEPSSSYLVALPGLAERVRPPPEVPGPMKRLDPRRTGSAPFLSLIHRLDGLLTAAAGMAMPRWALYDCAAVPGIMFGLAAPASSLPVTARQALALALEPEQPVPVSLTIAIPTLEPKAWLAYSTLSLSQVVPGLGDLREKTLRAALAMLEVQSVMTTTQWQTSELDVLARLAPLELRAAWLPAHSEPATLVARLRPGASAPPTTGRVDPADRHAIEALQDALEAGRNVTITGPAELRGGHRSIPIAMEEPAA